MVLLVPEQFLLFSARAQLLTQMVKVLLVRPVLQAQPELTDWSVPLAPVVLELLVVTVPPELQVMLEPQAKTALAQLAQLVATESAQQGQLVLPDRLVQRGRLVRTDVMEQRVLQAQLVPPEQPAHLADPPDHKELPESLVRLELPDCKVRLVTKVQPVQPVHSVALVTKETRDQLVLLATQARQAQPVTRVIRVTRVTKETQDQLAQLAQWDIPVARVTPGFSGALG